MMGRSGLLDDARLFERSDRAGAFAVASVWLEIAAVFVVLLFIGFVYVWRRGALEWT